MKETSFTCNKTPTQRNKNTSWRQDNNSSHGNPCFFPAIPGNCKDVIGVVIGYWKLESKKLHIENGFLPSGVCWFVLYANIYCDRYRSFRSITWNSFELDIKTEDASIFSEIVYLRDEMTIKFSTLHLVSSCNMLLFDVLVYSSKQSVLKTFKCKISIRASAVYLLLKIASPRLSHSTIIPPPDNIMEWMCCESRFLCCMNMLWVILRITTLSSIRFIAVSSTI